MRHWASHLFYFVYIFVESRETTERIRNTTQIIYEPFRVYAPTNMCISMFSVLEDKALLDQKIKRRLDLANHFPILNLVFIFNITKHIISYDSVLPPR